MVTNEKCYPVYKKKNTIKHIDFSRMSITHINYSTVKR